MELTIVAQADVRPWHYPPRLDFLYGDWFRTEFAAGNLAPWESPNPDLALAITQVLQADRPLFGPPPAQLLDPVPAADLRRAMLDGIPGLRADLETDTANVLLTFARIWVSLATGEILPKDAAADWVLARIPEAHRPVLARARGVYLGEAEDRWEDLGAVHAHADHVMGEIRRAHSRASARDHLTCASWRAVGGMRRLRTAALSVEAGVRGRHEGPDPG